MNDIEGCEIYRAFDSQNPVVVRVEPLRFKIEDRDGFSFVRSLYRKEAPVADSVKHPAHYTDRVPGIECIEVTQHFNFNLGNAIKYVWRSGNKGDVVEDLRKAIQYLEFEIDRIEEAPRDRAGIVRNLPEINTEAVLRELDQLGLSATNPPATREDEDEADWHDCDIAGCWED